MTNTSQTTKPAVPTAIHGPPLTRATVKAEAVSRQAAPGQAARASQEGMSRMAAPVVVEALVASRTRLADSALRWLTPRELDVLREMARGRANPGIAAALVLSESAVEKHVSSIFAKLGLGPEPAQDRRVTAVLTFLRDSPLPGR